jgi:hypothetical protein
MPTNSIALLRNIFCALLQRCCGSYVLSRVALAVGFSTSCYTDVLALLEAVNMSCDLQPRQYRYIKLSALK